MKKRVEEYLASFSGCVGGNIKADTWIVGIEYGRDITKTDLLERLKEYETVAPKGYAADYVSKSKFDEGLKKLLSVVENISEDKLNSIFSINDSDHFRINIYPIPFKNVSSWNDEFNDILEVKSKAEYYEKCREVRFPFFKEVIRNNKPKVSLCFGTTMTDDYLRLLCDSSFKYFTKKIMNKKILVATNFNRIVVVCPFLRSISGLNSNVEIETFAEEIKKIKKMIF